MHLTDSQPPFAFTRRNALKASAAAAATLGAFAFGPTQAASAGAPDERRGATTRYPMLKSINQWAFPYPQRMDLRECLQLAKDAGFDGIELNYDLENDLSPKAGTKEYQDIRRLADRIGIRISGLCSFLFWPYPLTSNDPAKRAQGLELAAKSRRPPTIWVSKTSSSSPAPCVSHGATTTSPCPTTCTTGAPRKPWPSSYSRPRSSRSS